MFLDEKIEDKEAETKEHFMFGNQKLAFQMAMFDDGEPKIRTTQAKLKIEGEIAGFVSVKQITSVPSVYPVCPANTDDNYLRSVPGLYPDLIEPLQYRETVMIPNKTLYVLWFEIRLPKGYKSGKFDLNITLTSDKGEELAGGSVTVNVIYAVLPPQKTVHTEWFYADCLADYYNVKVFSEKHWRIIENFIKCASENGVNLILTPVFTPALDTYIGGERLTVQLVDIEVVSEGKYKFGYEKLSRWVDICLKHESTNLKFRTSSLSGEQSMRRKSLVRLTEKPRGFSAGKPIRMVNVIRISFRSSFRGLLNFSAAEDLTKTAISIFPTNRV